MSTTPPPPEAFRSQSPNASASAHSETGAKTETTHVHCPCLVSLGLEHSTDQKKSPWEISLDYAKKHVNGEIALWKDEVDKLLIFATLFSGVAGAFALESFHGVRQEPTDTTALLLRTLITIQLNATNPQPNLPVDLNPQAPVTAAARRINIYNFLSLILSLSVVMSGILCLQWLREYAQDPHGIPGPRHEHLGIRYMRSQGMRKWGVFTILKLLPLILLLSLLLFFAGIIELLLGVDQSATIVASVVVGITSSFMLITTILPAVQSFWIHFFPTHQLPECPYKSPQAWIFYQFLARPIRFIKWTIAKCRGEHLPDDPTVIDIFNLQTWSGYDWLVYSNHRRLPAAIANAGFGVHWLGRMYLQEKQLADALYQCIKDLSIHDSLRSILNTRDPRRAGSADQASRWFPRDVPETEANKLNQVHVSDVLVFQTLAHLTERIERGHPPTVLFKERLDLYLKINGECTDPNIDCPLINDMDQKDVVSRDVRKTLLYHITKIMQNDMDVNESHLSALDHIIGLEFDTDNPDNQLFNHVLEALGTWIEKKGWDGEGGSVQEGRSERSKLQTHASKLYNRVHILRRLAAIRKQA
ncbi:hypothetical protein D9756_008108 [Leucocoprinus leucothites]|uniref:DUF6535 domain-containing protein n=1 Tax=Leucocoprinus leucothites TaxID=201217 RepID=A0A8H5FYC6_9AGAR|nr:hypothetical protein D9756_008108 [Leucoagaricus leucothites]